jgi:hypothetical protein
MARLTARLMRWFFRPRNDGFCVMCGKYHPGEGHDDAA